MNKNSSPVQLVYDAIEKLLKEKSIVIVSIDGMCGSGKTTLVECLSQYIDATIIHMDDFFLRPEQRTEDRLKMPGGNIDIERLTEEVVFPIMRGEGFTYKPFDCHTMSFKPSVYVKPKRVVIFEGTYSCHPLLYEYSDLHIFLHTDKNTQANRIVTRNGKEKARIFAHKWIVLENTYFDYYHIPEKCELRFST